MFQKKLQSATAMASQLVKDMAQRKESLGKLEHEAVLAGEVGQEHLKGGREGLQSPGLGGSCQ